MIPIQKRFVAYLIVSVLAYWTTLLLPRTSETFFFLMVAIELLLICYLIHRVSELFPSEKPS